MIITPLQTQTPTISTLHDLHELELTKCFLGNGVTEGSVSVLEEFTFDGDSSSKYGLWITSVVGIQNGQAVVVSQSGKSLCLLFFDGDV